MYVPDCHCLSCENCNSPLLSVHNGCIFVQDCHCIILLYTFSILIDQLESSVLWSVRTALKNCVCFAPISWAPGGSPSLVATRNCDIVDSWCLFTPPHPQHIRVCFALMFHVYNTSVNVLSSLESLTQQMRKLPWKTTNVFSVVRETVGKNIELSLLGR